MQSPPRTVSRDLQRAPKPVIDKQRALKFWEDSESSRSSGNANFYKALRNNKAAIIVVIVAVALVYFRLQEATYKDDRRMKSDSKAEDDPFKLLGLKQGASASQVKAAYKKLSLQLHPDKNPDCKDCAAKFSKVAKAYRSLTHVGHKTEKVKDVAKEQDEEERDRKMMSDSAAITDLNYKDLMSTKAAWLVLFYSDDSDESWNLHPSWERVVEELRDLQALGVGRIDIDLDKAARREFIPESDLQPPAIMYRAPDGSKQWYQGRPRSIDILEFVSNCMSKEVAQINDLTYKSFLADNEGLVRVMLFARDNNIKLYRVFHALALQYPQMRLAVVAQKGANELETKYKTTISDKAIIMIKDRVSKPLKMSSRLLYDKMLRVLEPNKFPVVVAATQSNIALLCDPPGGQPCVLLVVPKVSEDLFADPAYVEFKAASDKATKMRRKFYLDKKDRKGNALGQDFPWFAILDASTQPYVAAALGINASAPLSSPLQTSGRVVAYDASQKMAAIFKKEDGAQSRHVYNWASTLAVNVMNNATAALSPSDRASLDKSAVTWAPADILSSSTWKSTISTVDLARNWLVKHRETLITLIIIIFCVLAAIIWNDIKNQKLQEKKKDNLAKAARPVALAAQAMLQREEEEKEAKRRLDEEARRAREQALKEEKERHEHAIAASVAKPGKK